MDVSVMTVSMAGAEEQPNQAQQQPVFHDFLGICSGHRGNGSRFRFCMERDWKKERKKERKKEEKALP
jgi:hypothetical protein